MKYNYQEQKQYIIDSYGKYDMNALVLPESKIQTTSRIVQDSVIGSSPSPNFSKHFLEEISNILLTQKIPQIEAPQYNLLSPTVIAPTTTTISRLAIKRIAKAQKKSNRSNVVPTSSFETSKTSYGVERFDSAVEWDPFEINQMRSCGVDAYLEMVEASKIALAMKLDDYRLVGDGSSVKGFLNHDEVPIITNDNNIMDMIAKGEFDAVTDIFIKLRDSILDNSVYMVTPDTFIISEKLFNALNSVRSTAYQQNATNVTLMDYVISQTRIPKERGGFDEMNFMSSKRLMELPGYNAGIKITDADRTRIICARLGGETKTEDKMGYHDWVPFTLYPPVLKDQQVFNQYMEQGTSQFYLLDDKIMAYLDIKIA